MANKTDPLTKSVHGTNPQFLLSQIIRNRIYNSQYWKEHCFGLSADSLVDKAAGLQYIGGTYGGNRKPTPFLCLLLKLLQIGPDADIVEEYINQTDFKYLQALGAVYLRLTGSPVRIYELIEPLVNDNRKLRLRSVDGDYKIIHMDEFGDELLHSPVILGIDLPALPPRKVLEESDFVHLVPRESLVAEEFELFKAEGKLDELPTPDKSLQGGKWTK